MDEKLIKQTRKQYKSELPNALHQFRHWYPENPEERERVALLALYVQHNKEKIEEALDPRGALLAMYNDFGLDAFQCAFVFSGIQMLLDAAERQRKDKAFG